MPFSRIATFDVVRTLANGSISGTYAKVGTSFGHLGRAIRIINSTNGDMFFALNNGSTPASDGTADNLFLPAGTFVLWDISTDAGSQTNSPAFCLAGKTQVWVRQSTAPTTGSVFVECLIAVGE